MPLLLQADETLSASLIVGAWIFVVGSIFGSFFNVVIYRLPLGLSLSHPPSRCPVCEHPIRWRDNLPVLGWLILRGRCRDCKTPISARYPLVEAVVGLLFAGLAWMEVLAPRSCLPSRPEPFAAALPLDWGTLAYHLWLACTLLIATLIEFDGNRTPPRLLMLAFGVGLAAPLFWPGLRPVPLAALHDAAPWLAGLTEGLAGLAAGAIMGCLAWPATALAGRPRSRPDLRAGLTVLAELALVGVFLGWQAAAAIAVATGAFTLIASVFIPRGSAAARAAWPGALTTAVLLYLAAWDKLVVWRPELGPAAGLLSLVYAGLVLAGLALLAWGVALRPQSRLTSS